MANPLRAENYPVHQFDTGETDSAMRLQRWRDDYLSALNRDRSLLLTNVERLVESLQRALTEEETS